MLSSEGNRGPYPSLASIPGCPGLAPAYRKAYTPNVATCPSLSIRHPSDPVFFALPPQPRCKYCGPEAVTEWYHDIAAHLKSVDPNHLVTTGEEGAAPACLWLSGKGAVHAPLVDSGLRLPAVMMSPLTGPPPSGCPALPAPRAPAPSVHATNTCAGFFDESSSFVAADPTDGNKWGPRSGQDFVANHDSPNIDYTVIHMWPDNWGVQPNDVAFGKTWIDFHTQASTALGKPLLMEGAAWPRVGPGGCVYAGMHAR